MARIRNQKALRREFWRTAGYKLPHRKTVKFGDERHYPTDTRVAFVDFVDSMQRGGEIDERLAQRATLGSFAARRRVRGTTEAEVARYRRMTPEQVRRDTARFWAEHARMVEEAKRGGNYHPAPAPSGFGSVSREHDRMLTGLLTDTEGHLASAERVLRGGDCVAGVESTLAAERTYGEARAHLGSMRSKSWPIASSSRMSDVVRRLNFLRQALKRCVG